MGIPMRPESAWNGIIGIVFDAVGTLIKPDPSVAEAYTATAARQGVELEPDDVRARFQVHFQSDEVHGNGGALSTDEATERRRWRMIVTGVLPEMPDLDRAFDELWEHFSTAGVVAMLSRMWRPRSTAPGSTGALGVRRLQFRWPVAASRPGVCPSWRSAGIHW